MPQRTTGPQKTPFSLRQGSESIPAFLGEHTDNDDPANIPPGSFRTAINVILKAGAIFPRGGKSKVNTSALGSPVVGLHLTGDGSINPCTGGEPGADCGSAEDSALIWEGHDIGILVFTGYVFYYLGVGTICLVTFPDQVAGDIFGRPYWGLSDGLGSVLYAPGSGGPAGTKDMRVGILTRGPHPYISGVGGASKYGTPLNLLFRRPDPYNGSPVSGFYSMCSLLGAPNLGTDGEGETFFLGWSKKDGSAAAATDFHVYRYETTPNGESSAIFAGEVLFDTTSQGHMQVYSVGNGEVIAILNAPSLGSGSGANHTHVGRAKVRSASGVWSNLTLDVSALTLSWVVLGSLRNVVVRDAKVFQGKLWLAVVADAFNAGGTAVGDSHGYLFSYDGTTYKAERVLVTTLDPADSVNDTGVCTLEVFNNKLWYGWNDHIDAAGTAHGFIGSYDGSTYTDVVINLTTALTGGAEAVSQIRHLIRAVNSWWALTDGSPAGGGGGIVGGSVARTTVDAMTSGWAFVTDIPEDNRKPAFVATNGAGELSIPNIVVL